MKCNFRHKWLSHLVFFLCIVISCSTSSSSTGLAAAALLESPRKEETFGMSVAFHAPTSLPTEAPTPDFECASIACSPTLQLISQQTYFHQVVAAEHASFYPLLLHRVCEAFQKCIPASRIRLILQSVQSPNAAIAPPMQRGIDLLTRLSIPFESWFGVFTADKKMLRSYKMLHDLQSSDQLIYQTDTDEIPDADMLARALEELSSGECDAIRGKWVDRLALTGTLDPISIHGNGTLHDQFPLRCHISHNFVGAKTEKVLVYRSLYRLDGGHHEVWCSPMGSGKKAAAKLVIGDRNSLDQTHENHSEEAEEKEKGQEMEQQRHRRLISNEAMNTHNASSLDGETASYVDQCLRHIRKRNKKLYWHDILSAVPQAEHKARYCPTTVKLDHFKFIDGLQTYLATRMDVYKTRGMGWWTDSWRFLTHLERHGNAMCTDCKSSYCYNTAVKRRVKIDHEKKFYCAKTNSPCSRLDGTTLVDARGTK